MGSVGFKTTNKTRGTLIHLLNDVFVCVRYLYAVAQTVQLLVVDWSPVVRWAGLCTGRRLRRRDDLVAARDSSHRCEDANFSPRNFLFVHLHRLRRTKWNRRHMST